MFDDTEEYRVIMLQVLNMQLCQVYQQTLYIMQAPNAFIDENVQ